MEAKIKDFHKGTHVQAESKSWAPKPRLPGLSESSTDDDGEKYEFEDTEDERFIKPDVVKRYIREQNENHVPGKTISEMVKEHKSKVKEELKKVERANVERQEQYEVPLGLELNHDIRSLEKKQMNKKLSKKLRKMQEKKSRNSQIDEKMMDRLKELGSIVPGPEDPIYENMSVCETFQFMRQKKMDYMRPKYERWVENMEAMVRQERKDNEEMRKLYAQGTAQARTKAKEISKAVKERRQKMMAEGVDYVPETKPSEKKVEPTEGRKKGKSENTSKEKPQPKIKLLPAPPKIKRDKRDDVIDSCLEFLDERSRQFEDDSSKPKVAQTLDKKRLEKIPKKVTESLQKNADQKEKTNQKDGEPLAKRKVSKISENLKRMKKVKNYLNECPSDCSSVGDSPPSTIEKNHQEDNRISAREEKLMLNLTRYLIIKGDVMLLDDLRFHELPKEGECDEYKVLRKIYAKYARSGRMEELEDKIADVYYLEEHKKKVNKEIIEKIRGDDELKNSNIKIVDKPIEGLKLPVFTPFTGEEALVKEFVTRYKVTRPVNPDIDNIIKEITKHHQKKVGALCQESFQKLRDTIEEQVIERFARQFIEKNRNKIYDEGGMLRHDLEGLSPVEDLTGEDEFPVLGTRVKISLSNKKKLQTPKTYSEVIKAPADDDETSAGSSKMNISFRRKSDLRRKRAARLAEERQKITKNSDNEEGIKARARIETILDRSETDRMSDSTDHEWQESLRKTIRANEEKELREKGLIKDSNSNTTCEAPAEDNRAEPLDTEETANIKIEDKLIAQQGKAQKRKERKANRKRLKEPLTEPEPRPNQGEQQLMLAAMDADPATRDLVKALKKKRQSTPALSSPDSN